MCSIFIDLIYFYSCFFGPLPDSVDDFQHLMKHVFPMVFDTKYLADNLNKNSGSYNSSLEDLDRELSYLPQPVIGKLLYPIPKGRSLVDTDLVIL